jgi:single-strand DNA-binding protein
MSNLCIFTGNLGKDPENRFMPSGGAVTNFSIATSKKWKDKNTGQIQELTTWVPCVAFNRIGEVCGEYLKKGSKAYVECEYRLNKWQDKDGNDRYSPEFIVQKMEMLSSKDSHGGVGAASNGSQSKPQQSAATSSAAPNNSMDGDFSDGIPF